VNGVPRVYENIIENRIITALKDLLQFNPPSLPVTLFHFYITYNYCYNYCHVQVLKNVYRFKLGRFKIT